MQTISLPSPYTMQSWDLQTMNLGVSQLTLIENSAREALDVLAKEQKIKAKQIFVFMGAGNNGSDALCLARHLQDLEAIVTVIHTRNLKNYKGSAQKLIKLAKSLNLNLVPAAKFLASWQKLDLPDIIIDGILGTGFSANLGQVEKDLISWINKFQNKAYVLALDVPSGLNSQNGLVPESAVFANSTVCFQAAKPGLILDSARKYTGKIFIRNIGIPKLVQSGKPANFELLSPQFPLQNKARHKGDAGHLLIFGTSKSMSGAAKLAGLAGLHQGAGLVTLALPKNIKSGIADLIEQELQGAEDFVSPEAIDCFDFGSYDFVAMGMGFGKNPQTLLALEKYLALANRPATLFDADALNLLATKPELLGKMTDKDIITPHPKEAARLLQVSITKILENRINAISTLTKICPAITVLKGVNTLIAKHGSAICISPANVPNLAVAGSGDVLSGIIGSLAVQYAEQFSALAIAKQGVYQHILAALYLSKDYKFRGNLASQIAAAIPFVDQELYWPAFNIDIQK